MSNLLEVEVKLTEVIPPELVELARSQGKTDEEIKELWAQEVEGCVEYHGDFIYDNVEEKLEEE